ncbi:hypothetical protein EC968_008106 [Mortierella alpina]|nr:hypothetical protein EC968_008106 [Mortierella alpina]
MLWFEFSEQVELASGAFRNLEDHGPAIRAFFLDQDGEQHSILIKINVDDEDHKMIWDMLKALGNQVIGLQVRVSGRLTFFPYISNTTGEAKNLLELLLINMRFQPKPDDELPLITAYEGGVAPSETPSRMSSASSAERVWSTAKRLKTQERV